MNDYSFIITEEFADSVLHYMWGKGDYDKGELISINFADVAEFGHTLGITTDYIEDDLDVMAETVVSIFFDYVDGDEFEAVFRVRKGFYHTPEGHLRVC